jgi:NAD-dependent SIR2 family protein deacetylase
MNLYLVPAKPVYEPGSKVLKQIERKLKNAGIIKGYYDKELQQFAPGPEAGGVFEDLRKGVAPFTYIEFCEYEKPHFVPDSHGESFDATCLHCDETIEDGVVTVGIEAFNDGEVETFDCPECDEKIELSELHCLIDTATVRFAIYIRDAAQNDLSANTREILAEVTGQRFRVIEETS